MAQRILYVPITLVAGAVGQVHFQRATEAFNRGTSIAHVTEGVVRAIMMVTFVPFLAVSAFGRFAALALLGSEWGLAGTILAIRSVEFFFTSAMFSISYVFVVLGKQKLNLLYTGAFLACNLGVIYLAGVQRSDAIGLSFSLSLVAIVMNAAFVLYALRCVGARWLPFAGAFLAGSASMAAAVLISFHLEGVL